MRVYKDYTFYNMLDAVRVELGNGKTIQLPNDSLKQLKKHKEIIAHVTRGGWPIAYQLGGELYFCYLPQNHDSWVGIANLLPGISRGSLDSVRFKIALIRAVINSGQVPSLFDVKRNIGLCAFQHSK